jgi:uncharacterized protein (TIGR02466 family)
MSLDMLFASPVYTADIGADIVPKDVVDKLRSKDLSNPWHDTVKTTFKYDKSCNLIEEFGLVSFEKKLVDELANYLIAVGISGSIDLRITEAWANFYERGDYQHFHYHPGADVCAVYYVEADEDTGDLLFESPSIIHEQFSLFDKTRKLNTAPIVKYQPKTGKLVIFPGYLKHAVVENKTDKTRISIAVNFSVA